MAETKIKFQQVEGKGTAAQCDALPVVFAPVIVSK